MPSDPFPATCFAQLPPKTLTFHGPAGPLMIIDLDNRTIDVMPDVAVSEAAAAVIALVRQYLRDGSR